MICFLPIVLTSLIESEFVSCDVINYYKCHYQNNSSCETVNTDCINGYKKWTNFTKNILKIKVNQTFNLEIVVQPKNGALMKNMTVRGHVHHCIYKNCSVLRYDFETKYCYDFDNGN